MSGQTLEEAAQSFAIRVAKRGRITVMSLRGDFDANCKQQFGQELEGIGRQGTSRLLIDLLEVSFIDSAGLRMILEAWSWAQGKGFEFAVVRGDTRIRRIFELTGLNRALPMIDCA